ncbi:MAG: hypothetical protein ABW208_07150 [Pyrinomonadaceae bacterium]
MAEKKQSPNVQLATGARPLGKGPVTVGTEVICELPSPEEQAAGFYCEAAERLTSIYPGRFKVIVKKGSK